MESLGILVSYLVCKKERENLFFSIVLSIFPSRVRNRRAFLFFSLIKKADRIDGSSWSSFSPFFSLSFSLFLPFFFIQSLRIDSLVSLYYYLQHLLTFRTISPESSINRTQFNVYHTNPTIFSSIVIQIITSIFSDNVRAT